MEKFKIGQKVKCIATKPLALTNGRIYTVLGCDDGFVNVMNDNGNMGGYIPNRFEAVETVTVDEIAQILLDELKDSNQRGDHTTVNKLQTVLGKIGYKVKITTKTVVDYEMVEF